DQPEPGARRRRPHRAGRPVQRGREARRGPAAADRRGLRPAALSPSRHSILGPPEKLPLRKGLKLLRTGGKSCRVAAPFPPGRRGRLPPSLVHRHLRTMSACRATVTSTDDGDDEGETMRIAGNERDEDFAGDVRDLVLAATRKYAMKDDRGAEGVLEIIVESVRDFAGRTLVSHVVAELVDERVAASWEHGWQPVDLDRFVGRSRRQPERDLLGDAMAARLAQFATSTIDPEWWDQLADIGARVWWSNDRNW